MSTMGGPEKFSFILNIVRVSMYFIAGLAIMLLPIPLFKNVGIGFKIAMGLLFVLYSAFRGYQLIQARKKQADQEL